MVWIEARPLLPAPMFVRTAEDAGGRSDVIAAGVEDAVIEVSLAVAWKLRMEAQRVPSSMDPCRRQA